MLISLLQVVLAALVFGYAALQDIQTRRVTDRTWIPLFVGGVLIVAFKSVQDGITQLYLAGISLVVGLVVGSVLYSTRIMYGADFKAIVGLSLLIPTPPQVDEFPIHDTTIADPAWLLDVSPAEYLATDVFVLTVISNAVMLTSLLLVVNVLRNMVTGVFSLQTPVRSFLGKRIHIEDVEREFGMVIEGDGRDAIYSAFNGITTAIIRDYMKWHREVVEDVSSVTDVEFYHFERFFEVSDEWMSDAPEEDAENIEQVLDNEYITIGLEIPFIVSLLLGLITATSIGNLLFIGLSLLL